MKTVKSNARKKAVSVAPKGRSYVDPVLGRVTVAPAQEEGQSWGEYLRTVVMPMVHEIHDKTPEQRRESDRRRKERLARRR